MHNSNISDSIDRELDNFRPDSHWDDDAIIAYYKKKAREICAKLEEEEKNKKKNLLLLNNNRNLIIKKGNPQNMRGFIMKRASSCGAPRLTVSIWDCSHPRRKLIKKERNT
jgi:hypothetical protein